MSSASNIAAKSEWCEARRGLLATEKALAWERDAITAALRALPGGRQDKDLVFAGEVVAGISASRHKTGNAVVNEAGYVIAMAVVMFIAQMIF